MNTKNSEMTSQNSLNINFSRKILILEKDYDEKEFRERHTKGSLFSILLSENISRKLR